MISQLRGVVIHKQPPELVLDVGGVGYEIQASMQTFYQLPLDEQAVLIYTHLSIREDAHTLFGFASREERDLFRLLLKVNGVGPKLALTIVSGMTAPEFAAVVQIGDANALARIPGIGKKTAERLILDLRDKINNVGLNTANTSAGAPSPSSGSVREEALNALIALGYKPAQATQLLKPYETSDLTVEALIREALKNSMS